MTNLEGRVLRRRRALDAAGRGAQRAVDHGASSPRRLGAPSTFPTDPREVFEELRRATAGGLADYSGHQLRPARRRRGRLLAVPAPSSTGHAAAVPDAFAHAGRPRPARRRSTTGRPGRRPAPRRAGATSSPAACSQHYQSGAQTRRVPELTARRARAVRRDPPARSPQRLGDRRRRPTCASRRRAGRRVAPARVTDDIRPDTVFLPFHFAGDGQREPADQRRHRPDLRDAGVQGVRGRGLRGGRRGARVTARAARQRRRRRARHGRGRGSSTSCPPPTRRAGFDVTVLGAEDYEPYNRVLLSDVVAGQVDVASLTLPRGRRSRRPGAARADRRRARPRATARGRRPTAPAPVRRAWSWRPAPGRACRTCAGFGSSHAPGRPRRAPGRRARAAHARRLRARSSPRRSTRGAPSSSAAAARARGRVRARAPRARGHARARPRAHVMDRQLDVAAAAVVAASRGGPRDRPSRTAPAPRGPRARRPAAGSGSTTASSCPPSCSCCAAGTVAGDRRSRQPPGSTSTGRRSSGRPGARADPPVYAIGDCAQPPEGGSGLIAQGWDQARRLAVSLTARRRSGDAAAGGPAAVRPPTDVVRVKAAGLDLVTMGVGGPAHRRPGSRTVRLSDPTPAGTSRSSWPTAAWSAPRASGPGPSPPTSPPRTPGDPGPPTRRSCSCVRSRAAGTGRVADAHAGPHDRVPVQRRQQGRRRRVLGARRAHGGRRRAADARHDRLRGLHRRRLRAPRLDRAERPAGPGPAGPPGPGAGRASARGPPRRPPGVAGHQPAGPSVVPHASGRRARSAADGRPRARFSRHLLLPQLGEDGQRRLAHARVAVVGAGGLGPRAAVPRRGRRGPAGIVDGDVVERATSSARCARRRATSAGPRSTPPATPCTRSTPGPRSSRTACA